MKVLFISHLFLCALLCCSCVNAINEPDEKKQEEEQTQVVAFSMILEQDIAMTKSDNDEPAPAYLIVLDEYAGKKSIAASRSLSEDGSSFLSDFSLSLSTGSHKLYFVVATKKWASQDIEAETLTWETSTAYLGKVWAVSQSLNVTASTTAQTISLPLRVGMLRLVMEDAVPSNLSYFVQTISGLSWTLDLNAMSGINAKAFERKVSMPSAYIGKTNIMLDIYTFIPASGSVGTLTFKAYSSSDEILASHEFTNVSVISGHIHQFSGAFFSITFNCGLTVDQTNWVEDSERY